MQYTINEKTSDTFIKLPTEAGNIDQKYKTVAL